MTKLLQQALERVQALPDDEQNRLAALILEEVEATEQAGEKRESKPLWEVVQDITNDVPDGVWETLPEDGATEVDHYLYDTPKRHP